MPSVLTLRLATVATSDRVDLWPLDLDGRVGSDGWWMLGNAERERAERFCFEKDRRRYVAGRALVRVVLGAYLDRGPAALPMRAGPAGKPYLGGGGEGIRFNLSNAGGVGLLAVTRGREVGVDLEPLHEVDWGTDVARRFFSASEVASLNASPEFGRSLAFLRGWTRKEALLKGKGDGLLAPLHDFDVSLHESATLLTTRWDPADAGCWHLLDVSDTVPGHVAALAVEGSGWRTSTRLDLQPNAWGGPPLEEDPR